MHLFCTDSPRLSFELSMMTTSASPPVLSAATCQPALWCLGLSAADPQHGATYVTELSVFVQQLIASDTRWTTLKMTMAQFRQTMNEMCETSASLEKKIASLSPVESFQLRVDGQQGIASLVNLQSLSMQLEGLRSAITGALIKNAGLPGQSMIGFSAQERHQLFVQRAALYFDQHATTKQKKMLFFQRFVDEVCQLTNHQLPTPNSRDYKPLFRLAVVQSWRKKR